MLMVTMRDANMSITVQFLMQKMKNKKQKKEVNIQLIPIYIPDAEFQERKKEIQNLIARMVVAGFSKKPGRPKKVNPNGSDPLEKQLQRRKRKTKI
jgi:hypothetical protein